MRRGFRALAGLAALAAVVYALTTLGGWDAFLDASGISEVAAKADGREAYRALDSQCSQITESFPDDVVGCRTPAEFMQDLRMACANAGVVPADHFVVATPGSTEIAPIGCR